MADRIGSLVAKLPKDADLTEILIEAIESMSDGFALFDEDDRLVICNSVYLDMYSTHEDAIVPGASLEEILRVGLARGAFPAAAGREEEWLAERLQHHHSLDTPVEQELSDGRHLYIRERRTERGGIVGIRTDVTNLKETQEKLLQERAQLESLLNTIPDLIFYKDNKGVFVNCNQAFCEFIGKSREEIIGCTDYDFFDKETADAFREHDRATLMLGLTRRNKEWVTYPDGSEVMLETAKTPILSFGSTLPGVLGISRDITEMQVNQKRLQMLSAAVDQSPTSIVLTDLQGRITYVNRAFERTSGYRISEVLGRVVHLSSAGFEDQDLHKEIWTALHQGLSWSGELYNRRKDGSYYWEEVTASPLRDRDGKIVNYLATKEDIDLRKRYEERIFQHDNYDDLTGLPNKMLAYDRLNLAIAAAENNDHRLVTCLVDIDDLTRINETLGIEAGDMVIKTIGERLDHCIDDQDTVARLGGDTFLIILQHYKTTGQAEVMIRAALNAVAAPLDVHDQRLVLTARAGISLYPQDGKDASQLVQSAQVALNRARNKGWGNYAFFIASQDKELQSRLTMEMELRRAIDNDELDLAYQPIVNAQDGSIVGCEALLRWNSERLGPVPPDTFIPIAEAVGMIDALGAWVIDTALQATPSFLKVAGDNFFICINFSPLQVRSISHSELLERCSLTHGVPLENIKVEITESAFLDQDATVTVVIEDMVSRGIRLSLDDFGTGYSALSHLQKFDFDTLKIDRTFVGNNDCDNCKDPDNLACGALLSGIIGLCRGLKLNVVAEGVETKGQYEALKRLGVNEIQGYYFSKPLNFKDFLAYIS